MCMSGIHASPADWAIRVRVVSRTIRRSSHLSSTTTTASFCGGHSLLTIYRPPRLLGFRRKGATSGRLLTGRELLVKHSYTGGECKERQGWPALRRFPLPAPGPERAFRGKWRGSPCQRPCPQPQMSLRTRPFCTSPSMLPPTWIRAGLRHHTCRGRHTPCYDRASTALVFLLGWTAADVAIRGEVCNVITGIRG